ncbi:MAG: ribosomal RNA small subunit methyltransferase A, partial [Nitrosopumilaceae archaeon]
MIKRKRLGQHFLHSQSVAKKIVEAADITKKDTVLEIGTGKGILVSLLCEKAGKVVSIESDLELYNSAKEKFSNITNLTLLHGDGFASDVKFTIFVSNLPYSKSRDAMEWLVQKKFRQAVVMVQKEFAQKIAEKTKAVS